jgi:hypothetical protein
MFWLKGCPKCIIGDLYQDKDRYGTYIACLQCSHYLTEEEEAVLLHGSRLVASAEAKAPALLVAVRGAR